MSNEPVLHNEFSKDETRQIREMFGETFKDLLSINLRSEEVWKADHNVYTRNGRAHMEQTGTYKLFMQLPIYRYDTGHYCFKGSQTIHQLIMDTLAKESVAQSAGTEARNNPLSGIGLYDRDPAPDKVIPFVTTTKDMDKLKQGLTKSAEAVGIKLSEVKKAYKILSDFTEGEVEFLTGSERKPSEYLIEFRPETNYRYHQSYLTQKSGKQIDVLENLKNAGAISLEWYGISCVISLHDLKKLEAAELQPVQIDIPKGGRRSR